MAVLMVRALGLKFNHPSGLEISRGWDGNSMALKKKGIVSGNVKNDGVDYYEPAKTITRGEFLKILINAIIYKRCGALKNKPSFQCALDGY
ncbi:S-layer homology domain-containing protein [Candidatus Thiothrix anitrata]|uniref:S-layer homology domain-containing protein n=1 Tax=Candidatus Thiothrix anitrata TaxID=2823902 RepID=A0ABX7WYC1_9GAMM|nr:S-layer homology domain-containing protein [Candidatus Thiothrix anitrata]QTR48679.1 S-layer homology domain-containing protein [Candidatus Thiothrix anitrata]